MNSPTISLSEISKIGNFAIPVFGALVTVAIAFGPIGKESTIGPTIIVSFAIYTLLAAYISYLHRLSYLRLRQLQKTRGEEATHLPLYAIVIFMGIHLLLIIGLLWLFHTHSLLFPGPTAQPKTISGGNILPLDIKLLLAITSGIFSLLGGLLGAFLARKTQYEKWLRESRSNVYSKFIDLIQTARKNTTEAIYDQSIDDSQRKIAITDYYNIPIDYMKIVRLYLPKNLREKFEKLGREVWALHANIEAGQSRLATMDKKLDEIQKIFESNL